MKIESQVFLKDWTWWKIGGPADHFCLPRNLDELRSALGEAARQNWPVTLLGGGTNILVSDRGVRGLVICFKQFTGVETSVFEGRLQIEAWAGTAKSELTKIFLKEKLAPALFLCGLPGDVGGGVVMNAGVGEAIEPREFVEIIDWIEVLRGEEVIRLAKSELEWVYRRANGWRPGVIVRAGLSWPLRPDDAILKKVREATANRMKKQPLRLPSCGSTFKNPPGQKAGALIDQCGLKGFRVGDAEVSTLHANFIVNRGDARASDVDQVIRFIKKSVREKFEIELETEVQYLGEWNE